MMEETLTYLNGYLQAVLQRLNGDEVRDQLQAALHNHEEGVLPSPRMTEITTKTIDLLHNIEQILEPGHLVLADHFLGKFSKAFPWELAKSL